MFRKTHWKDPDQERLGDRYGHGPGTRLLKQKGRRRYEQECVIHGRSKMTTCLAHDHFYCKGCFDPCNPTFYWCRPVLKKRASCRQVKMCRTRAARDQS